ncbi:MAG: hypothetical protein QOE23_1691 [Pseudonocardiales bacterium]|nr:hypothetical protein [Pseudonocardiales bacterium]
MGSALAVVVLILLIMIAVGYSAWLKQGIRTRVLESSLSADQL